MKIAAVSKILPVRAPIGLYGSQTARPWNGEVHIPLEINLIAFRDATTSTIIVGVDQVYANELSRRIKNDPLNAHRQILFVASHTHFSPGVVPEFPGVGPFDEHFCSLATELVQQAIDEAENDAGQQQAVPWITPWIDSQYKASQRRTKGVSIQRKFPFFTFGTVMRPPNGGVSDFPLALALLGDSSVKAVIWTFACHPTNFPNRETISSEFPGVVRDRLRALLGEDIVVVFLQGASGDIRPPFATRNPKLTGFLNGVLGVLSGFKSTFVNASLEEWETWASGLADKVEAIANEAKELPRHVVDPTLRSKSAASGEVFDGKHAVDELRVANLALSNEVSLLFVNAEITHELSRSVGKTRDIVPKSEAVWATCFDESLGYLTTREEYFEGGYESNQWGDSFSCSAKPKETGETVLSRLVKKVT